MRSLPWQRADRIAEVRERIWLHLSPAAGLEQHTEQDVLTLARLHFLLTPEA